MMFVEVSDVVFVTGFHNILSEWGSHMVDLFFLFFFFLPPFLTIILYATEKM